MSTALKGPVWTWEIPVYFFIGGVAGVAAAIALVATVAGAEPGTIRAARGIAAGGALISPFLLISDLGRPARFLYMLRVFKPGSAMSVGAWTLVVFSGAAWAGLGLWWIDPAGMLWMLVSLAVDVVAAAAGLVLATYTGVLLGATVIPVWAERHRTLPFEFGVGSLGAAVSTVELLGGFTAPLNRAAIAAAAIKTALWLLDWRRQGMRAHARPSAHLSGWIALVFRVAGLAFFPARVLAALSAIVGSLLLRFERLAEGRRSVAVGTTGRE